MADNEILATDNTKTINALDANLGKLPSFLQKQQEVGERAFKAKIEAEAEKTAATKGAEAQVLGDYAKQMGTAYEEYKSKLKPEPEFKPTQENAIDIGAVFSMIATMGVALGGSGKLSGLNALNAMGGMLKGYQQGRKDLFAKEQAVFDKELQSMKAHNEALLKDLQEYSKLLATDRDAAMAKQAEIVAKNPGVIAKNVEAGKWDVALDIAKANSKLQSDIISKSMKTGLSGGTKSAINERFQNTVIRSANETLRSLQLMENIGIDIGKGAFGGVVGKGTLTSEAVANLGRAMTSQDQLRYNAAAGGMALELAYVLNGGYKPNETQIAELKNLYLATPQDTYETAAFKFADVVAKLKAALEVAPAYTPEQKQNNQMLLEKLTKYETPENILRKISGEEPQPDPYLRSGEKPKPTQADIDYYKNNKTPDMKQKFINRFGVDPDTLG